MDVASNEILTEGLSMPHSPRVHNGELYVLDSGGGYFGKVDRDSGALRADWLRERALHERTQLVPATRPPPLLLDSLSLSGALIEQQFCQRVHLPAELVSVQHMASRS